MPENKVKRIGKFYDSTVNVRIRERMDALQLNAPALHTSLKVRGLIVTPEGIRQWISGYSQPKLESIPLIASVLDCSINYLFGGDSLPDMTDTQIFERTRLAQPALNWLRNSSEVNMVMLNLMFATGAINDVLSGIAFYALKEEREIQIIDKAKETSYSKILSEKVADDVSMFVAQQNFANAAKTCKEALEIVEGAAQNAKD